MMNKNLIVFLLLGMLITTVISSCTPKPGPTAIVLEDPFTIEITSEDGAQVSWEGFTKGFYPGVTVTTPLDVKNNTDESWPGKVCIFLLEPSSSGHVLPLAEREFTLTPGEGFEEPVTLQLPRNLPSGTYALTLVVKQPAGPGVSVTPIRVGEGGGPYPADAWPTEAALQACQ